MITNRIDDLQGAAAAGYAGKAVEDDFLWELPPEMTESGPAVPNTAPPFDPAALDITAVDPEDLPLIDELMAAGSAGLNKDSLLEEFGVLEAEEKLRAFIAAGQPEEQKDDVIEAYLAAYEELLSFAADYDWIPGLAEQCLALRKAVYERLVEIGLAAGLAALPLIAEIAVALCDYETGWINSALAMGEPPVKRSVPTAEEVDAAVYAELGWTDEEETMGPPASAANEETAGQQSAAKGSLDLLPHPRPAAPAAGQTAREAETIELILKRSNEMAVSLQAEVNNFVIGAYKKIVECLMNSAVLRLYKDALCLSPRQPGSRPPELAN